jgi:diacylglycerol kinase
MDFIMGRLKSIENALRGIRIFLDRTPNTRVAFCGATIAIGLGIVFDITESEWLFVVFSIGFVFVAEAFNTAIEIHMDLTSPGEHPYARDTKDVAAGAVVLSALTALVVGLIIFLPRVIALFS